jgi:Tol biopolymer transport system component
MKKALLCSFVALNLAYVAAAQQTALFQQDVTWSPDGKYLAFCGMHDFDQVAHTFKADIYVIRADGSDMKKISSDEKNEFYTAWAKDRIYFGVEEPGTKSSNIYSARWDGSDLRQVTNSSGRNSTPAVSRDGKRIAFVSTRDGDKYQIYSASADGSDVKRLTTDAGIGYFNPQFSPDGKRIVYYAEKGDSKDQIWVMNSDGSNQTLLTNNIGHNIFPGWSPDGKEIIFASSKRDQKPDGSYVDASFLYVMSADKSNSRKLGNINSFFARFSPDGKRIAFVSGKFPSTNIFIANADGSSPQQITKQ